MNSRTRGRALTLVAVTLLLPGCGSDNPVTPAPVAVAPSPVPSASPGATAGAYGCALPSLPDLHNECPKLTPQFSDIVNEAIDKTIAEHPSYFDLTAPGPNYPVKDRSAYIGAVVKNIQAKGVCSREEKEEIQVKTTNAFNEQYNIWTSSGLVRHAPGAYITTCFPAQF
jgi:hypothetical protein